LTTLGATPTICNLLPSIGRSSPPCLFSPHHLHRLPVTSTAQTVVGHPQCQIPLYHALFCLRFDPLISLNVASHMLYSFCNYTLSTSSRRFPQPLFSCVVVFRPCRYLVPRPHQFILAYCRNPLASSGPWSPITSTTMDRQDPGPFISFPPSSQSIDRSISGGPKRPCLDPREERTIAVFHPTPRRGYTEEDVKSGIMRRRDDPETCS